MDWKKETGYDVINVYANSIVNLIMNNRTDHEVKYNIFEAQLDSYSATFTFELNDEIKMFTMNSNNILEIGKVSAINEFTEFYKKEIL